MLFLQNWQLLRKEGGILACHGLWITWIGWWLVGGCLALCWMSCYNQQCITFTSIMVIILTHHYHIIDKLYIIVTGVLLMMMIIKQNIPIISLCNTFILIYVHSWSCCYGKNVECKSGATFTFTERQNIEEKL